jgi:hypothetical protein
METKEQFLILPIDGQDASILVDALVAFANQEEAEGDACGVVERADEIAAMVRQLREIAWVEPEQWLRHIGTGRYKRRPQG